MSEELIFMVTTGYGWKHRQPFVNVTVGAKDFHVQMSPAEARDLALNLLESAEAAEQDAFLFEWAQKEVGVDDAGAATLLAEFRKWREDRQSHDDN